MVRRVDRGDTGRAPLVEIMPLVLDDLRSTRYAVTAGVSAELSPEKITADLDHWRKVTRKLQCELVGDEHERSFIDLGYAGFLLDDSSTDTAILRGLNLVATVIGSRERSARKDGRWTTVQLGYPVYLRGLCIVFHGWILWARPLPLVSSASGANAIKARCSRPAPAITRSGSVNAHLRLVSRRLDDSGNHPSRSRD